MLTRTKTIKKDKQDPVQNKKTSVQKKSPKGKKQTPKSKKQSPKSKLNDNNDKMIIEEKQQDNNTLQVPQMDIENRTSRTQSFDDVKICPGNFVTKQSGNYEDKYILKEKLGEGAGGQVYKVVSKDNKQVVRAMKIMRKDQMPDLEKENFLREVELQKLLDHPNILKVYEYFENSSYFHLVTEYVEGKDLIDEILERDSFTEKEVADIMQQLLSGLAFSHKNNLMHRDIKPDNILITKKQGKKQQVIKIIDWGYCQTFDPSKHLESKCGTADYCAPEVFHGKYTEKRDLWSVGCILYTLLAMNHPFTQFSQDKIGSDNKVTHISATQLTIEKIRIGKVNYKSENLQDIGEEAIDLTKKLLTYKPENRLSAEEALKHPWFESFNSENQTCKQKELQKLNLNNLKQYRAYHKLQQAVMSFIASQLLSEKQKEKLTETFSYLDKNKDGRLSKDEILQGYKEFYSPEEAQELVDQVFEQVDLDKNGNLEYTEFLSATMSKKMAFTQNSLKKAFDLFDQDGDEQITAFELQSILGHDLGPDHKDLWEELVKEADTDGDGQISFKEFKQFMMKMVS